MKSGRSDKSKLSNLSLIALLGILGIGILLDGTLYNRVPPNTAIHPIDDAQSITAYIDKQPVVALKKVGSNWHQTHPISAPAQSDRVQPLLDTNNYSQRSYSLQDLPHKEIFAETVKIKIDNTEYHFGAIEPVSKLRYVRSGNRVYLQPDTILPMLSAADTVFVDLKITNRVERVTIGDTAFEQPEAWHDLEALSIVDTNSPGTEFNSSIEVHITEENQSRVMTAAHSEHGYTITNDQNFTYLLSDSTAEKLGLQDLLPNSHATE